MARSWGKWLLTALMVLGPMACDSKSTKPAPKANQSAAVASSASASPVVLASGVRPLVPRGSASVANRQTVPALKGPKATTLFDREPVAQLLVPVGETLTQPVLVVLTTPETAKQCKAWESIKPTSGFLLCPTPAKASADIVQHFKAAIKALEKRFGEHVGPRSTLVGYGAAADAAVTLMRESPILFPRGFLIGGGVDGFSSGAVQAFAAQGGERVLFACKDCQAGRSVSNLLRSGIASKHLEVEALDAKALGEAWAWLSEGDPWWKPSEKK